MATAFRRSASARPITVAASGISKSLSDCFMEVTLNSWSTTVSATDSVRTSASVEASISAGTTDTSNKSNMGNMMPFIFNAKLAIMKDWRNHHFQWFSLNEKTASAQFLSSQIRLKRFKDKPPAYNKGVVNLFD